MLMQTKSDSNMLTLHLGGSSTRWAAGLVGCVLAALGLTALLLRLGTGEPLVAGLAVSAAVWLAWVAVGLAFAPLRAARVEERQRRAEAVASAPPAFVDTEATWWSALTVGGELDEAARVAVTHRGRE